MLQKTGIISFFSLFMLLGTIQAHAQWGISYHQSKLPFVGINYTFSERFMPELRLGTDEYFDDVTLEPTISYQYVQREEYQLYVGLGVLLSEYNTAVVIPTGMLIYPFDNKKFGFHIEVTPIIMDWDNIFRGSWGIRYRFLQE